MSGARMFWLLAGLAVYFAGSSSGGYSQAIEKDVPIARLPGGDIPSKIENGFQIFWHINESPGNPNATENDPDAMVRIFEGAAFERAACRVFLAISQADPTATGISIYDVSARKPGFIAVAAVYERVNGDPVAVLLYFDWDGSLLQKVVLDKLPEIEALEIDDSGHVWTLNDLDPDEQSQSVFSEYDRAGSSMKQFVKPLPNWSTAEGVFKGGQTSLGLVSGQVWAWLPESRTLIVV